MKWLLIVLGVVLGATMALAEVIGSKDEFKNEDAVYNVSPSPICGSYGDLQKFVAFRDARQFELASSMKQCVYVVKMIELVPVSTVGRYRKVVWVVNGTPIDAWVIENEFRYPHNWAEYCKRRNAGPDKPCFMNNF